MKPIVLASAAGLALTGLAACAPGGPPTARTALDCPDRQGDLQRSSIAPDQKSCIYATSEGDQVTLRLIPVSGSYQDALAPVEQELRGEVLSAKDAEAKAKDAEASAQHAEAEAGSAKSEAAAASKVAKQAAEDALKQAHDAQSEAKDAADEAASTHIDLPGIHISADEGGKADVDVGAIHVASGDEGATIQMSRDVRLRGEAFSRQKRGFRATFILARDDLKDGWRAVGYQAAGPKAGPITVAVIKSKSGDRHGVLDDVKRLVRRNSGT
jgi:hypothetical protein